MDKKLVSIKEAAKMLGVSALTLRNWDNSGKFPATRHPINNYRVYKVSDIENLIVEMETSHGVKRPQIKKQPKKLLVQHV